MSGKRLLERDDEFDTDADREPCGWGCGHRRGTAVYKASGYFGGYLDHDDSAALTMSYLGVSNNNAYADNLSLVLNTPAAASTFLGCNLIVNGDAEAGIPIPPGNSVAFDIPGWVRTANFTTDTYVDSGEVSVKDPGPADRGKFLFFGGPENEASSAFQCLPGYRYFSISGTGRFQKCAIRLRRVGWRLFVAGRFHGVDD